MLKHQYKKPLSEITPIPLSDFFLKNINIGIVIIKDTNADFWSTHVEETAGPMQLSWNLAWTLIGQLLLALPTTFFVAELSTHSLRGTPLNE